MICLHVSHILRIVSPCIASIIKKKKGNTLYYYVVESARVDGKPRIVHQTYLGTAEGVARLVQDSGAPVPLAATTVEFGLPAALWLAAEKTGVFALLEALWPKPRSGPSTAHYLLMAAIHRICEPGPKTEVADWYWDSILSSIFGFAPERFTSQAFWDWVGLSYVLDGDNVLSLCHHLCQGHVADAEEFPEALHRIRTLLERNQIAPDTVTLVPDKGSAALANTLELEKAGVGWISALPWNQAPAELRSCQQLTPLSSQEPGVSAAAQTMLVHGKEYLCVVKYSAPFASEQLHSLTTSVSKAMQSLRRLARDLQGPSPAITEKRMRGKIARWLSPQHVRDLIHHQLEKHDGRWHLQFSFDHQAMEQLMANRLGRTVLLTNHLDWTPEQVVTAYSGQQHIEQVFRGLKDGDWLGWGPMYHWTDQKIRVHAFYCMLGISLLQHVKRQAQAAWPSLSTEQLLDQLRQIEKYNLLYPPQGNKGPNRVASVLSKQTLTQQRLAQELGLDQLGSTQRR
jgi:hypothetical protein